MAKNPRTVLTIFCHCSPVDEESRGGALDLMLLCVAAPHLCSAAVSAALTQSALVPRAVLGRLVQECLAVLPGCADAKAK